MFIFNQDWCEEEKQLGTRENILYSITIINEIIYLEWGLVVLNRVNQGWRGHWTVSYTDLKI